jgi:hypothetical protein
MDFTSILYTEDSRTLERRTRELVGRKTTTKTTKNRFFSYAESSDGLLRLVVGADGLVGRAAVRRRRGRIRVLLRLVLAGERRWRRRRSPAA